MVLLLDRDPQPEALSRLPECRVVRAAGAREFVDLAKRLVPDVVVVDVAFPGLGAGDLTLMLEQHPGVCDVPVIFLSRGGRDLRGALALIEDLYSRHEDAVTRLPPKRAFRGRVAEEVARSHRSGASLSVLIVEIDKRSGGSRRASVLDGLAVMCATSC